MSSAALRAIVLTDLVDSSRLTSELGADAFATLMQRHDDVVRKLVAGHAGREIDRTDGFKLLFEWPVDAVRFALAYHEALASIDADGEPLTGRVGIHFGEVRLTENSPDALARGAKPVEVEGLAVPIAARVMSLAAGGQTLLTHTAFDLAQRAAVGQATLPPAARWLAHGPYKFKGIDDALDVFEIGIEGRAPLSPPPNSDKAHRAIRLGEEELLGWRPAAGGEVRRRPGWSLERKLGEGGFGEVWLARNPRTGEHRVFKFCFVLERLRSLKRELTLFLLLKEVLGERGDIQRIYDLNFDEPPYFLELDYADGGDLAQWAGARGGIATVPLARRIELVAQVADAAAAAHSLGIIHKDIKPSNVLIGEARDGTVTPKLTDFGIGQLADKSILDRVQVQATGFTAGTLAETELSSRTGTRLYMAPELISGRLPSIQSDVYALGVLLFQVVVGDFGQPVVDDWRERVRRAGGDTVLVEDFAACLAGEPSARLASATDLATRLRSLPGRRRVRRRRNLMRAGAVASAVMAVLLATSVIIINRERSRADLERDLRQAAQQNEQRALRAEADAEARRREAEEQRDIAFRQYQGTGGLVTYMLGELREALDLTLEHDQQVAAAVGEGTAEYYEGIDTTGFSRELLIEHANQLVEAGQRFRVLGLLDDSEALSSHSLQIREELLGPDDFELASPLTELAQTHHQRGDLERAHEFYRRTLEIVEAARGPDHPETSAAVGNIGGILSALGRPAEALQYALRGLAIEERALGPDDPALAINLANVGIFLQDLGRLDEAQPYLERALALCEENHGPDHIETARQHNNLGVLLKLKGDLAGAIPQYERALAVFEKTLGPGHPLTATTLNNTGAALYALGRLEEARPYYERTLASLEAMFGPEHPHVAAVTNNLASLVQKMGDLDAAQPMFERALAICEKTLGPEHPSTADLVNNLGKLHAEKGEVEIAEKLIERAIGIYTAALGAEHPYTTAAAAGLATLRASTAGTSSTPPAEAASPPGE